MGNCGYVHTEDDATGIKHPLTQAPIYIAKTVFYKSGGRTARKEHFSSQNWMTFLL